MTQITQLDDRYIVINTEDLNGAQMDALNEAIVSNDIRYSEDCVVVKSSWPMYQETCDSLLAWINDGAPKND